MLGGETIGSWIQWGIGLIATLITIWITVEFYSNDHTPSIRLRVRGGIYKETNGITVTSGNGITLDAINTSKTPALIIFKGIRRPYRFFHRLERWLLRHPFKYFYWAFVLRDWHEHEFYEAPVHYIEDAFRVDDFMKLESLQPSKPIEFLDSEYSEAIAKVVKERKRTIRRMKKGKTIAIDIVFMSFDGTEYSVIRRMHRTRQRLDTDVYEMAKKIIDE